MKIKVCTLVSFISMIFVTNAQTTHRERPAEWNGLSEGGRFMDLFRPIPVLDSLTSQVWGGKNVVPRYKNNGIEDKAWSYWGGNILMGNDGKYHMFVCRWREDSSKGHMEWPNSEVVHAVSKNPIGPFKVVETIGKGHNPEAFQLQDGRYAIYVIDGYYLSNNINGPWTYVKFDFDPRDRPIIEGLSNLSFAKRENGSYLMVCRGGSIWLSKDGVAPYNQTTDKSVYPPVQGEFEDPVVWRDHVQYHMIVNDWLGRIAFYLRSKNGIKWKIEPGEAYLPGIAKYEDGTMEDWFKYERIKILQDSLGRAVQANFAVIDTLKFQDKPLDGHSSKNIGIPLAVPKQLELLHKRKISSKTKTISVRIKHEKDFNPITDLDLSSLRFGAPEKVNFGKGCKAVRTEKHGADLIVHFDAADNGIGNDNFTVKLLGKTKQGELVFGYARLPWINYIEPILSARDPKLQTNGLMVRVDNFGQVKSRSSKMIVEEMKNGNWTIMGKATIPKLDPFGYSDVLIKIKANREDLIDRRIRITILHPNKPKNLHEGKVIK